MCFSFDELLSAVNVFLELVTTMTDFILVLSGICVENINIFPHSNTSANIVLNQSNVMA